MTGTYGQLSGKLLATLDRHGLSWRMCQGTLLAAEPPLLETLPEWGTASNGELFELQKPERLTNEKGSLLLPTPTAWVQDEMDTENYLLRRIREKQKGRNGNGFGLPLDMAIKFLGDTTTELLDDGKKSHEEPHLFP